MNNFASKNYIELKTQEIADFYDANPNINYEKANLLLIEIFKNCINYKKKDEEIHKAETILSNDNDTTYLNDVMSINKCKELHCEQNLEVILNKINPISEIIINTNSEICGDYIIVTPNKVNIIVENKIIKSNVSLSAINMFINSCKTQKINGILMSQHTGITGKQNFEIDFIDSNVIIYIHMAKYNEDKIQMAIEIIHKIYNKIAILNAEDSNISISSNVLYEIKNEYQHFINQREQFKNNIKSSQGLIIQQIDNMKLLNLDEYLSTKFTQMDKKSLYKCNLCNFYTSNTLKGMAAHKRGCKKKITNIEK